jgi:hypothetical protein
MYAVAVSDGDLSFDANAELNVYGDRKSGANRTMLIDCVAAFAGSQRIRITRIGNIHCRNLCPSKRNRSPIGPAPVRS